MKSAEEMTVEEIRLVNAHLGLWSETDGKKRLALAQTVYASDIRVIDPGLILNGHTAIIDFIENLLTQNPGFKFTIAKPVETHHQTALLSWQFGPESKPDTVTGQDVFTIADGKIVSILVFVHGLTKQLN